MSNEVSLSLLLQASLERSPSPATLNAAWHERTLAWAQSRLIDTICFGTENELACEHAHCRRYFEWLPEAERATKFHCLGKANTCHGELKELDPATGEIITRECGHQWFGNRSDCCPICGNEYVPDSLQRLRWYEALITLVSQEAQDLRAFAGTIVVDLMFRIADFVRKSVLTTLVEPGDLKGYERNATAIRRKLQEMGHDLSTDVYDACNWAARYEDAMEFLGVGPERYEAWTRNMQRQFVPVLNPAIECLLGGIIVPADTIARLLDQDKAWPEIIKDLLVFLGALLQGDDPEPDEEEDGPEEAAFTGYVVRNADNPDLVLVIVPVPTAELTKFQMKADLETYDRGVGNRDWKKLIQLTEDDDAA